LLLREHQPTRRGAAISSKQGDMRINASAASRRREQARHESNPVCIYPNAGFLKRQRIGCIISRVNEYLRGQALDPHGIVVGFVAVVGLLRL
jgi:hypothetical protein